MYPTIYHALYDMFGLDWAWTRLLNSFGFFVALAFVVGNYTMSLELQRKAGNGLMMPVKKKVITGGKPDWMDIITTALMGFVVGWKMLYLFVNGSELFNNGGSPQKEIFSSHGYLLWGLILAGLFGGWRWYEYRKRQLPEPVESYVDVYPHHLTGNITFMAAIFGIIGAKLFHLFENPDELVDFFQHPSFNNFISGLTVYGGLILGSAGVLFYAWKKRIALLHLCDAAAPGMIFAYGIGRIGCQVSGDGDWGIANTSPKPGWLSWLPDWMWAYDYPNNVNYDASYHGMLGPLNDTFVVPITDPNVPCFDGYCTHLVPAVYPTPFYETIMATLIFILLWSIRKKIKTPGYIFGLYLMFNGIERFFIEKIRVNNKFEVLGIQATQAEIIAILFVLTGAIMLWYLKRRKKVDPIKTSTAS